MEKTCLERYRREEVKQYLSGLEKSNQYKELQVKSKNEKSKFDFSNTESKNLLARRRTNLSYCAQTPKLTHTNQAFGLTEQQQDISVDFTLNYKTE